MTASQKTPSVHDASVKSSDSASPTLTYHRRPTLQIPLPILDIIYSTAGGAHYSGAPVSENDDQVVTSPGEPSPPMDDTTRDRIMADLRELYCCRASKEIFERTWRPDAVFEDPLVKCEGYAQYAPQPRIFSKSETVSSRVMSFTRFPKRLIYSQTQEYTLRYIGTVKRIESIIVVDLDDDDKIIRMTDQWNGEALSSWFGVNLLRRANALVTPWFVGAPRT
ncbi:hypothetical protein DFJ58DRAFT_648892 [Suillus subalutaceus]|uniref:uncharacterized protein n=1 Tax=Suillus subalutaceus TaxID=48586 RepID=UPI001B86DCB1|nr:uncharacterized protein DFJ58DRAFT_648892 [Suillus subalutaceus]KAG1877586.1 hypothetical protein DFJ58DRAFT_648892 [Suillus subalutaceus]